MRLKPMTAFICLLAALLGAAIAPAKAQSTVWTLLWSDEFNGAAGTAPDPAKWAFETGGGGWGNNELETYTNARANSYQDGNGNLAIKAISQNGSSGPFTSARIKTQGLYALTYGKCEARVKIPYGQGIWPAFWLLGANITTVSWPACGEIDTMENIGREPGLAHGSVHGPGYDFTSTYTLAGGAALTGGYHLYTTEWDTAQLRFYVDGVLYGTYSQTSLPAGTAWAFDKPFFLLLNLAVGGNWPGNPDATTVFPQTMLVDYVRVYAASRPGPVAYALNAGGATVGGFESDTPYVDSGSVASTSFTPNTQGIASPPPNSVLQTERYGLTFTYTLNGLTPNAAYTTRLTFGEGYWTTPNQRIQNVSINGVPVLTNFTLPPVQNNVATMTAKTFTAQADSAGILRINFAAAANSPDQNAEVRAIEVRPAAVSPNPVVYQVNAGGGAAPPFAADGFASGGVVPAPATAAINVSGVANPAPQAVYQSQRYGNMTYTFPSLTPNAMYQIRLHFAETYWTKAGQRVFHVAVNGVPALTNYDIIASVGSANRADIKTVYAAADSSGAIAVTYQSVTDNALASGIEVLATGAAGGTLRFDGIAANAPAQSVTFTFRPTDKSGNVTQTVSVSPNGAFALSGLPRKPGVLHSKAATYLAANLNVDLTGGGVSGLSAMLPAGDANGDNSCDPTDFGLFVSAYNSSASIPGSGYDPACDFNGDGLVDPTDFGLFVGNYGAAGDL